jgi:hypothetical protein
MELSQRHAIGRSSYCVGERKYSDVVQGLQPDSDTLMGNVLLYELLIRMWHCLYCGSISANPGARRCSFLFSGSRVIWLCDAVLLLVNPKVLVGSEAFS